MSLHQEIRTPPCARDGQCGRCADHRKSPESISRAENDLKTRFKITDSGKCVSFLGIKLIEESDGSGTMCQRRYIDDILKRFGTDGCKAVISPVDISFRLVVSDISAKLNAPFQEKLIPSCTRRQLLARISHTWCAMSRVL